MQKTSPITHKAQREKPVAFFRPAVAILAALLACCLMMGAYYAPEVPPAFSVLILVGILSFVIIYFCLLAIYRHLSTVSGHAIQLKKIELGKTFALSAGIIFILWIPYLFAYYPGNVPFDALKQLEMYFGVIPITNHHPPISTYLMGLIVRIGRKLIDLNFGVFLFALFQSILCAMIYGYLSAFLKRFSKRAWIISLLFFGIVPMWGIWAATIGKDTLYYAVFALFFFESVVSFLSTSSFISEPQIEHDRLDTILFILSACIMVLFRKDAIFLVGISLVILLIIRRKQVLIVLMTAVIVYAGSLGFSSVMNIAPTTQPYDAYAVMFQQTARTVATHGDELSDHEQDVIDRLLNIDTLADRYNPINADPVKDQANIDYTGELFSDYLPVWLEMGLSYPKEYLTAYMQQSFGYFDPFYYQTTLANFKNYIHSASDPEKTVSISYAQDPPHQFARNIANTICSFFDTAPIISLLCSCGAYTWLLMICITFIIMTRRWKALIPTVPLILLVLICTISPVTDYLRYEMPLMAAAPVLLAYTYLIIRTYGFVGLSASRIDLRPRNKHVKRLGQQGDVKGTAH